MNLKDYIVVKSSTGSIDLWTKAVYKRYLDGHTIGDGTGHPYTAITTFNADDRLADIPSTEENAIREEAEVIGFAEWLSKEGLSQRPTGEWFNEKNKIHVADSTAHILALYRQLKELKSSHI